MATLGLPRVTSIKCTFYLFPGSAGIFGPYREKNLARHGIRARAGIRANNRRAQAGLKISGLKKPGLQNRHAARPGPVQIPVADIISIYYVF